MLSTNKLKSGENWLKIKFFIFSRKAHAGTNLLGGAVNPAWCWYWDGLRRRVRLGFFTEI